MKKKFFTIVAGACIIFNSQIAANAYTDNNSLNNSYDKYKVYKQFYNVDSNKKFLIKFSNEIDKNSVKSGSIEIRDDYKNNIPINLKVIENTTEISPKTPLMEGKDYYLIIHNTVKGKKTKCLKQDYICPIKVKKKEITYTKVNNNEFISSLIKGAKLTYDKYGVYPSVTIGQAILESNWGRSDKAQLCNNLFGIKADKSWNGDRKSLPTKEWENGKEISIVCDWRSYKSISESLEDHGRFLYSRPWYAKAGVFDANNYKEQIIAIHRAGYATDPSYASKICSVIERYKLWQYDENGKDLSQIN